MYIITAAQESQWVLRGLGTQSLWARYQSPQINVVWKCKGGFLGKVSKDKKNKIRAATLTITIKLISILITAARNVITLVENQSTGIVWNIN